MSSLDKAYSKWDKIDLDSDDEIPVPPAVKREALPDVKMTKWISEEEAKQLKKYDKTEREVWQIYVRRLRCWNQAFDDDGNEIPPSRPYRIILTNLYPLGRVAAGEFSSPPCRPPTMDQIMKVIINEIKDPAKENGNPHRPEEIVFDDQYMVDELAPTLAAIGIYTRQLCAAEGVKDYIQKISDVFLKEMDGGVNYSNTLPGMIDQTNVSRLELDCFYNTAYKLWEAGVWDNIGDRQAFVLRAKEFRMDNGLLIAEGHIFVSILGRDSGPKGLAVFYNQSELENRAKPDGEELLYLPKTRICQYCGKIGTEISTEMKRCTRCKTVYYCNADCQKKDWKNHKSECVSMEDHPKVDNVTWGFRESSVIFQKETELSFVDLEDIDENHYNPPTYDSYPFAITYRKGEASRPTATELFWIIRAMKAAIEVTKPGCEVLRPNNIATGKMDFDIEIDGKSEHLEVINTCVLCKSDVRKKDEKEEEEEEEKESINDNNNNNNNEENSEDKNESENSEEIDEEAAKKTETEINEVD